MNNNKDALSKRNLWCFSLGGIGRDLAGSLFTSYILTFVLYTKTLTDAQFAAISMTIVIIGIFDAFNDPIMGNIIEVTRTKWGKFKPWIAIGMILTCIVFYISFSNNLQGWNYVILFGILYLVYSIVFTMNDIAYWGMVPALARQKQDRDTLTSRAILFAGIGAALTTIIVPTFTAGDNVIGGNALVAYSRLALIFCIIFIILQSVTLIGVKEEPLSEKGQVDKVGFKTIIGIIKNNDQLVWCIVIFLLHQIAANLINGGLAINYIYFEFGYNGFLFTLFSTLGALAAAFVMLFFTQLSKRFTRDRMMRLAIIAAVGGYLFMLLIGLIVPASMQTFKFALLMAGNLFALGGMYVYYLIMMICIANTVEYNEWKSGERAEGIIFSIRPFITKLSFAIIQFIVMVIFILVGVRDVTNQISDLENKTAQGLVDAATKSELISSILANVPGGKNAALLACMTLIPVALALISYYLYNKKYIITEKKYDEILAELRERNS